MDSVLVAYASFGEGHKKAALAIAEGLGVSACDVLDFTHPLIKKIYVIGYLLVTERLPLLWKLMFTVTKSRVVTDFIHSLQRLLFLRFFSYLKRHRPNIIIVTHFSIPVLLAPLKNGLDSTIISIVTDIRAHPLWASPAVDRYFVALGLTADDLRACGVKSEKITSGYVALRRGFRQHCSLEALYQKFGLPPRPSLLFISSLRGSFPFIKKIAKQLLSDFNILVICGNNVGLQRYLQRLDEPCLRVFSSYEAIWELMELSSVIITKPGGLTVFEGIYKKKLFIFTHFIPGQEKENMDFLIAQGVARFAADESECLAAIRGWAKEAGRLYRNYPISLTDVCNLLQEIVQGNKV